jgi:hypothetical protein
MMALIETSLANFNVPVTGRGVAVFPWFCHPNDKGQDRIDIKCYPDGSQAYPGVPTNKMMFNFHRQCAGLKEVWIYEGDRGVYKISLAKATDVSAWQTIEKTEGGTNYLSFGKRHGSRNAYCFDKVNFWRVFGGKVLVFDWMVSW